jgi:hypothetical protein
VSHRRLPSRYPRARWRSHHVRPSQRNPTVQVVLTSLRARVRHQEKSAASRTGFGNAAGAAALRVTARPHRAATCAWSGTGAGAEPAPDAPSIGTVRPAPEADSPSWGRLCSLRLSLRSGGLRCGPLVLASHPNPTRLPTRFGRTPGTPPKVARLRPTKISIMGAMLRMSPGTPQ